MSLTDQNSVVFRVAQNTMATPAGAAECGLTHNTDQSRCPGNIYGISHVATFSHDKDFQVNIHLNMEN